MDRVFRFLLVVSFIASAIEISGGSSGPIVRTEYGLVQGVATGNLYAFRGIPYAAPPVGDLRWRVPQPPARWKGVRDASKFGNVCPQINGAGYAGNEDCLVLNVFVSQTPPSEKQPVMVYLHGGGGWNGDTQYTPTNVDAPPLANQGVVVVTVEYRLNWLAWLSHPLLTAEGKGSSGHYGFADMIAALKWVKHNIARFGGDPHRVMLFGQSSGSASVQALFASPTSKGLFSRAGMESGAGDQAGQTPSLAAAEEGGVQIAAALGCGSAADVLACMRSVPAETVVNVPFIYAYGPGVGSRFLPVDPFTNIQENGSPVPLLIGSNREEWSLVDDPNANVNYSAAIYQRFHQFGKGVPRTVSSLYPVADYSSPAYAVIVVDSDFHITCEVRTVARAAAAANSQPVWRYFYTKDFENLSWVIPYGAFHTAELFFLFGNFDDGQQPGGGLVYPPSTADLVFSQALMGYWARFAATGDPNGAGAVAWPRYDPTTDSLLQLDDTFVPIDGYDNPQCDYLVTLPQPF